MKTKSSGRAWEGNVKVGALELCVVTSVEPIDGRFGGKLWRITMSCGSVKARSRRGGRQPRIGESLGLDWCGQCAADRKARRAW